ncbi:hypothetical protein ACIBK9_47280 [Nonomuraea sp. NPDC050227]|uniref:hypothetical protein n=1 Tax=Nonomuraea sp. NPDC050227 TaxID=3364360 RepID=UPI0037B0A447
MTATLTQQPIYTLACDAPDCGATFEAKHDFDQGSDRATRRAARRAGWDVPPPRGKGSRSPYDFCPEHKRR